MTDVQAVSLIYQYARFARNNNLPKIMSDIGARYGALANPSTEKVMRWLGFCQGYLVATGYMSLEQVKAHSANPDRDIDLSWWHNAAEAEDQCESVSVGGMAADNGQPIRTFVSTPGMPGCLTYEERYAASALNNQGDYILPVEPTKAIVNLEDQNFHKRGS